MQSNTHHRSGSRSWRRRSFIALAMLLVLLASGQWRPQQAMAQDGTIFLPAVQRAGADISIASPNGRIVARVRLTNAAENKGTLRYGVTFDGETVISDARLGLDTDDGLRLNSEFDWLGVSKRTVRERYSLAVAERDPIPNRFNEYTIRLQRRGGAPARRMDLIVSVYDEGVALRYLFPAQEGFANVAIRAEHTQFAFSDDHTIYQQDAPEAPIQKARLSGLYAQIENPLTIEHTAGFALSIAEANVDNFPRMDLRRLASPQLGVSVALENAAIGSLPYATPWRLLMIADSPGRLIEQNYIMYNLADAQRIADPSSWLKPGKAIRVGQMTTAYARSVADFASARGIDYIEFDAGWYYGYTDEANPGGDPTQPVATLALEEVIQYAHSLTPPVGVVLYVNYVPLSREPDKILAQYSAWQVDGLKFGFVKARTQEQLRALHIMVQDAANYDMFVDIHDDYRPSGLTRTLPNLLTQEYVRGAEHSPGAEHDATIPFTRYLIGAADYTIPYYNALVGSNTRAHQLALSVVFFSPLKFVFWQDGPSAYDGGADADFFGKVATTWDETVVLTDTIGDAVSIARRRGDDWFVGTITDENARTLDVPLTFLDAGKIYEATIYSDGTAANTVAIETRTVTRDDVIGADMLPSGGQAIMLKPLP